jgi:hypothetical protein
MPAPPKRLTSPRVQAAIAGLAAAILAIAGFQMGRYTVDATAVANNTAAVPRQSPSDSVARKDALIERSQDRIIIRDIATIPFSELYDVLKSAPREQLLAWARDLESMPRGPRQRAAVNAYYKSLVQVDHRAAIEAVRRAQNINMREIALEALTRAAPESIWGELAEALVELPYPRRKNVREDLIWNWSAVDPVAAAQFITTHPVPEGDLRPYSLLCNWGQLNPEQARDWVEADPSRQTENAWRALVTSWAETDRAAAVNYALANASRPNFAKAIDELAYDFVREAEADATDLLLRLPPDRAKGVMQHVAHMTMDVILGLPEGYVKPSDAVAKWMVTLPAEQWSDSIGLVAQDWFGKDPSAATQWFNQLSPSIRDTALASFCRGAKSESIDQVLALGLTIYDPKLRDAALGQLVRSLGETKEEALQAIDGLGVGDAEKSYLRKVMAEEKDDR